jgi:hypothetical protein
MMRRSSGLGSAPTLPVPVIVPVGPSLPVAPPILGPVSGPTGHQPGTNGSTAPSPAPDPSGPLPTLRLQGAVRSRNLTTGQLGLAAPGRGAGETLFVKVTPATVIIKNGAAVRLGDIAVGDTALVIYRNEAGTRVAARITVETPQRRAEGWLTQIDAAGRITLQDREGQLSSFKVPPQAVILFSGRPIPLDELYPGYPVTVLFDPPIGRDLPRVTRLEVF